MSRGISDDRFERIYDTAVQIIAHRNLSYADKEEIARAVKIATELDEAMRAIPNPDAKREPLPEPKGAAEPKASR